MRALRVCLKAIGRILATGLGTILGGVAGFLAVFGSVLALHALSRNRLLASYEAGFIGAMVLGMLLGLWFGAFAGWNLWRKLTKTHSR